jgi:hypothetical protein
MIINFLALLMILATGAVLGILFTIRHYERRGAGLRADEDRTANVRDLRREPSALDSHDRLPI